jgi:hypothetical protein
VKTFKWLNRGLTFLVVLVAALPLVALTSRSVALDRPDGVDAALRQVLARGQSSDLVVEFAALADLSAAYGMDWAARGDYVVQTLQAAARRTQANAVAYLDGLGMAHRTFLAGNLLYVESGNLAVAEHLASLPGVTVVRAPITLYVAPIVNDAIGPQATISWSIVDTKADQFWSTFGVQGDGIVVSNIDTGVQWDHPALVNQFKCPGDPSDPACWGDPANVCGGSACDNNGHGSHTMGSIVAADDPGLPYIAGMAPGAKWIACKGCESSSCSEASLNACADWLLAPGGSAANRPHVVNNSWGGAGGNTWYLGKVQAWRAAGIFPIFAIGGSGPSCGTLGSPSDYQESFGSTAHDSSRVVASFASRGPSVFGHDPYTKPNISAPGVNICSTVPTDSWSCYSGTSMSGPHSAGAVALLWSCNASLIGQVDQTFQALQNSADAPPAGYCGAPPDGEGNYTYGYGYLNVLQAGNIWCGGPPPPTPTPTPPPPPTPTPTPPPPPTPTPPPDTMHVDSIQMSYVQVRNKFTVSADVAIKDQDAGPVAGATVSAQWTLPNGKLVDDQQVTGATGVAAFNIASKAGAYQICVTDVTKTGWVYDPGQNVETCDTITVP